MLNNYLVFILLTGLVVSFNDNLNAQDGRHSFSMSYSFAPDNLSYHVIFWSDDAQYEYHDDGYIGLGLGYGFNIIPFLSAQAKYELVHYRGIEKRDDLNINIDDNYFLVGFKIHPSREDLKTELEFNYIFTTSSLDYQYPSARPREGTGEGRGGEIGVSMGYQVKEIHSFMIEASGRFIYTDYRNSGISNFYGISSVFKVTYEVEF